MHVNPTAGERDRAKDTFCGAKEVAGRLWLTRDSDYDSDSPVHGISGYHNPTKTPVLAVVRTSQGAVHVHAQSGTTGLCGRTVEGACGHTLMEACGGERTTATPVIRSRSSASTSTTSIGRTSCAAAHARSSSMTISWRFPGRAYDKYGPPAPEAFVTAVSILPEQTQR